MEVGRFSSIGSGELWMGTEAPLIAQNMHTTIMKYVPPTTGNVGHSNTDQYFPQPSTISAMSVCSRDELGPIVRGRSSSANEASKPITMLHRRQTHVGNKPLSFSPVSGKYMVQQLLQAMLRFLVSLLSDTYTFLAVTV